MTDSKTMLAHEHPHTTLISASGLSQLLQVRSLVDSGHIMVFDCRHDLADPAAGTAAFGAGHIPHAHFMHLDRDLSGAKIRADGSFAGRHPLPERDALIQKLQQHGVSRHTQIVAYDAHGGMFAARLWWLLRWLGHDQVAVLDGGLQSWLRAGYPLSMTDSVVPHVSQDDLIRATTPLAHTVSASDIESWLAGPVGKPHPVIIDARSPDRFRGENETLDPVGGHIPGAGNRFFKDNLTAEGYFKPGPQLKEEWQALTQDAPSAVMQCGSGVTACHNLLALELAGLSGAALYPGSWSEWCAVESRPVATGDGKA